MRNKIAFSPEQAMLLSLCGRFLHQARSNEALPAMPEPFDWNALRVLALRHGVAGIVLKAVRQHGRESGIPQEVAGDLSRAWRATAFRNALLLNEYTSVAHAFNTAKIDFLPLKGISFLGTLYGDIGLRPCGDMDILVAGSTIQKAEQVLTANGYKKKREPQDIHSSHFHSIFLKKNKNFTAVLELHWDIDRPGSVYAINIGEIFKRSAETTRGGYVCRQPSLEDNIILNCFHITRSFSSGKILSLKNFIDVAAIISQNSPAISWPTLHARAEKYGVLRPVFLVLFMGTGFFNIHVPLPLWSTLERKGLAYEDIETLVRERMFHTQQAAPKLPNAFRRFIGSARPDADSGSLLQHMARVACEAFKREYYTMHAQGLFAIGTKGLRRIAGALKNNISSVCLFIFQRTSMQQRIRAEQGKKDAIGKINAWLRDTEKDTYHENV